MSAHSPRDEIASPRCGLHAEREATDACTRCGTFGCRDCMDARQPWLCSACFAREPDLAGGDPPLRYGFALKEAGRLTGDCAGIIFGGSVATMVGIGACFLVLRGLVPRGEQQLLTAVLSQLLSVFFCTLVILAAVDARLKRRRATGELYGEALRRCPAALAATLWAGLSVGLGLLALLAPGAVMASRYVAALPVAVLEPRTRRALRRSSDLTEERRKLTFALVATQAATLLMMYLAVLEIGGLTRRHAIGPGWLWLGIIMQWAGLGFCALLGLTTYTGLLAAEREQTRAARKARMETPAASTT